MPEVKTISAGELPGMRAAKPADAAEELGEGLVGVRAKALFVFGGVVFFARGRERMSVGVRRRFFGHAPLPFPLLFF